MGQRSRQQRNGSTLGNGRDGRWTVDRPDIRTDPIPIPPLPFEGARIPRERITKEDKVEFRATVGCPGCNAIKDNRRAQAHSDRCRVRIEGCLRIAPRGAARVDRRNEVINEALAEDVQRENRGKRYVTIPLQQQHLNQNQQHQQHEIREKARLNPT